MFLVLGLVLLSSCGQKIIELKGNALGTTYLVNYYSDEKQDLRPQFDSIFNVINQSLSTYLPDSDISRLNRGENITVDEHFEIVFKTSKQIYQKTDAYFDPSIGIIVNAYGFGPEKYNSNPSQNTIDSLMQYVNFGQIQLENNQVISNQKKYYLDFNAIAKGYTVDVLADFLKANGLQNYFVEIGGEIVASGYDLDNDRPWKFGIEKPSEDNATRELSYAIELNDKALATSGNYRKFRIDSITGQKYTHTINPKTGLAKKSDVLSATVISENCMTADAYATAIMAMGFDKAKTLIEMQDLSALIIYISDDNDVQTYTTKNLGGLITEF